MKVGSLLRSFIFTWMVLCCSIVAVGSDAIPDGDMSSGMVEIVEDDSQSLVESEQAARDLFNKIWNKLVDEYGWKNLAFPRQVVFLNGAPGAGKGTNTLAIMRELEIPSRPIEVSSLLSDPECEEIKSKGLLVSDDIVIDRVMKEILKPEHARGIIIDGYPRTIIQAYFLKFLIYKLHDLEYGDSVVFRLINFSVSRQVSIDRQLARGRAALARERDINTSDEGLDMEVRATDLSEEAAGKRYQIYEESIGRCIALLREELEFHEIKANGSMEEVKRNVHEALKK